LSAESAHKSLVMILGVPRTHPPELRPRLGGGGNAFGQLVRVPPRALKSPPPRRGAFYPVLVYPVRGL